MAPWKLKRREAQRILLVAEVKAQRQKAAQLCAKNHAIAVRKSGRKAA